MKLAYVILRDRIPSHGPVKYDSSAWDITFEAGLVTIAGLDPNRTDGPFIVPASNVVVMRPMATKDAGGAKR